MTIFAQLVVDFPDDPKVIEAGDLAELAYIRCVLRCRRDLTDGIIDRRVVQRWLAGIRGKPETHMRRLEEVGLVVAHERGWAIPVHAWQRRNPTSAEVEAKREAERERKAAYRRAKVSQRDNGGTPSDSARRPAGVQTGPTTPEPKPETEPEPEPEVTLAPAALEHAPPDARSRQRDLLWEAVLAVCGVDPARITPSSRGAYNRAVADLRSVDASPAEVGARAAAYRRVYPDTALTPTALAKHWPQLDPAVVDMPRTDTRAGRNAALLDRRRTG